MVVTTEINTQPAFLRTGELARRWGVEAQTLRVWRMRGTGPKYVRLAPTVVAYALSDVQDFEARRSFSSTSEETVARRKAARP